MPANIPKAVSEIGHDMMQFVTSSEIEFHELATPEKLQQRGLV